MPRPRPFSWMTVFAWHESVRLSDGLPVLVGCEAILFQAQANVLKLTGASGEADGVRCSAVLGNFSFMTE